MTPTRVLTVLTILGVAFFSAILGIHLSRLRGQRRIARHRRLRLLHRAGYRVLDTEVTATGAVEVDGERHEYSVRADALVRRWFRRYVAEFKGGASSARPGNRDTRRQLLEYATLFDVHGILLVDADAGRIHRIRFPALGG